ncbi:MAG: hypothetical protein RLZZ383_405 [Pseudomonadota bacterium]|jgi:hypothetical protein
MRRFGGWLLLYACHAPGPGASDTATPDSTPTDTPTPDTPSADTPAEDTAPPPRVTLTLGPSVACTSVADRDARGPFAVKPLTGWPDGHAHTQGGNGSLIDLDDDGALDVLAVGEGEIRVWWGDGIRRFDELPFATLAVTDRIGEQSGFFGAVASDLDADGRLDLIVSGRATANLVLRQETPRQFVDATAAFGIAADEDRHTSGASLSDIDRDGDLDLYFGGHGYVDESLDAPRFLPAGDADRLYLRDGAGFVDASDRLPAVAHDAWSFLGSWFDADFDGDDDLYLVNDFGGSVEPTMLLTNDGTGQFTHLPGGLGLEQPIAAMGLGLGDIDGNGIEDVSLVAWDINRLFLGQASGWFESAAAYGFLPGEAQTVGWGVEAADIQNDGWTDLLVNYGFLVTKFGDDNTRIQRDALYLNQGDGTLADAAAIGGIDDPGPTRGVALGDINRDGWLDVLKVRTDGEITLGLSRCGAASWMMLTLRQPGPNPRAVGATVRAWSGDRVWVRRVREGGTGFGVGQPHELHFGLGAAERLDRVEVTWPDGQIDTFLDVPGRGHHRLDRHDAPTP